MLCFLCGCTYKPSIFYDLSEPSKLSSSVLDEECTDPSQIFNLIRNGNIDEALYYYHKQVQISGSHDNELIQYLGYRILEQAKQINDPETQLITIFSAGITGNDTLLPIIQEGLKSDHLQVQLASIHAIAMIEGDQASETLIKHAFKSNYLITRLEAARLLAKQQHPAASEQIEGLMHKLDSNWRYLFPQLFALVGDAKSSSIFKRMLNDHDEATRIEAILCAARFYRDDFAPDIRVIATHLNLLQQEACAFALGTLRDKKAEGILIEMLDSPSQYVSLAALQALYQIGKTDVLSKIIEIAETGNLFAITILGKMPGSEIALIELAQNHNQQIRLNASLALLELNDSNCLSGLKEFLINHSETFAIEQIATPSKALGAMKFGVNVHSFLHDSAQQKEITTRLKEQLLIKAANLPEPEFLELAIEIFNNKQNDLVPLLVEILQSHYSEDVAILLKEQQQRVGAPLIRAYCNLALYRLKEPGPWKQNLMNWFMQETMMDTMQIRPVIPMNNHNLSSSYYNLTPEESARLLIDSFLALAMSKDDFGIDTLLRALQLSNIKNKFALAGLLIRAAE